MPAAHQLAKDGVIIVIAGGWALRAEGRLMKADTRALSVSGSSVAPIKCDNPTCDYEGGSKCQRTLDKELPA